MFLNNEDKNTSMSCRGKGLTYQWLKMCYERHENTGEKIEKIL